MRIIRSTARAAALAGVIAAVSAAPARADGFPFTGGTLGAPVTYQGGTVMVTFLYQAALFDNQLFAFRNAVGQTFDPASAVPLFGNKDPIGSTFSFDPGALWGYQPGDEIIFGICTNLPNGDSISCGDFGSANAIVYSGDASRNFDNTAHARVQDNCANADVCGSYTGQVVAFEDIREVDPTLPPDHDYNDVIFGVEQMPSTATPEPVTMTLLATGLAGMGGTSMLRRRRSGSRKQ